jgi:hypothetical protein
MALRTGFSDDVRDMWAQVFGRRAEAVVSEDEDEDNGGGVNDKIPYRMRGGYISEELTTPAQPRSKSLFNPSGNSIASATKEGGVSHWPAGGTGISETSCPR